MTYGAVMPDFGEKMLKRKIEKDLLNWITSGEKGRWDKNFFYIFYPTHIYFLYIVVSLLH